MNTRKADARLERRQAQYARNIAGSRQMWHGTPPSVDVIDGTASNYHAPSSRKKPFPQGRKVRSR